MYLIIVTTQAIEFKSLDGVFEDDTFKVENYGLFIAELPIKAYESGKVVLELESELDGTASVGLMLNGQVNYIESEEIKKGFNRIELEITPEFKGKPVLVLEFKGNGKATILELDVNTFKKYFKAENKNYIVAIKTNEVSNTDDRLKARIQVYSKKDFEKFEYRVIFKYMGFTIFSDNKTIVKNFKSGRVFSFSEKFDLNFPGYYELILYSKDWKFSKTIFILPTLTNLLTFGLTILIFVTISVTTVKHRHEILKWIKGLSVGQKFVLAAIFSLIFAAIALTMNDKENANIIAILAYFFLVLGVGNLVVEYILANKDKDEEVAEIYDPYPEVRALISLVLLSILIFLTPEITEKFPYLYITTLIASLCIALYTIYKKY